MSRVKWNICVRSFINVLLEMLQFSGHARLDLPQRLRVRPRPLLLDFPTTSVPGPGITMFLVTPLMPWIAMTVLMNTKWVPEDSI